MKVCFIVGTLGRGGAERQLVYMLRALQSAGIQLKVLCLTKGEANEKEIESLGIEVEWLGPSGNRIVRLLKIIANLRKRPFDVVQSSHFYTNIYTAVTGKLLGITSIGAIRNDVFSEMAANGNLGKWQLRLPENLIGNSETALRRAAGLGVNAKKLHFVRNVVESKGGNLVAKTSCKSTSILFAGRLVSQKNPELFVRLAANLVRDLPDRNLTFLVAGDGPLRRSLENYATTIGVDTNQICFLGEQADMSDVYARTDILVLTSEHEGTPNVVLEAMAYGIPVVATRVGGVSEILSEECGFLVDASDLDGLCLATKNLIQAPDLRCRLGRNGQQYVIDNHSLEYLTERLTEIYSKIIGSDRLNG